MRNYYDEFKDLTTDKMAQSIENMTYAYKQTRVPKKHYKKLLTKPIEELISDSISINLINTYFQTLQTLQKENEKWFVQALICLELGIKPSSIKSSEHQALELTYANMIGGKLSLINPQLVATFKEINETDIHK
ncbi:hypothetical protein [Pediococcus pentosaceus]|uniref:hypothetical protein n=1 Tax=Pediococcus pentosaceus TaxID=1255 RepID=UPI0020A7F36D|nr:hypothetical protein [Pediococcus pentosaceus]